jgi:hypothetical protein
MESLHLCSIFLLLILFFQYPPVDAKPTEVDLKDDFEDTKGAIRFRISKKNRQHNGQKKKYKIVVQGIICIFTDFILISTRFTHVGQLLHYTLTHVLKTEFSITPF